MHVTVVWIGEVEAGADLLPAGHGRVLERPLHGLEAPANAPGVDLGMDPLHRDLDLVEDPLGPQRPVEVPLSQAEQRVAEAVRHQHARVEDGAVHGDYASLARASPSAAS